MCIFTGDINQVSSTRIFARLHGGKQAVVYDMNLDTKIETAMVLPVPMSYEEGAYVEFVDISECVDFFNVMDRFFPKMEPLNFLEGPLAAGVSRGMLKVEEVGMYEASFVPTRLDFGRLDPRFQLDEQLFNAIPEYSDYGFVVFKLKPGNSQVHPMAFWFTSRSKDKLFFPTVHMHRGLVPEYEYFDHILYAQGNVKKHPGVLSTLDASESERSQSLSRRSKRITSCHEEFFKQELHGFLENKDVWFELDQFN